MNSQAVELKNWEWDEMAGEIEWIGDPDLALENKSHESIDDEGAPTETLTNLTPEELALVASVHDAIRDAKPVGLEVEAGQ